MSMSESDREAFLFGNMNAFAGQYFREWKESIHVDRAPTREDLLDWFEVEAGMDWGYDPHPGVVLFGASGWRGGRLPWWVPALWLTSLTSGILAAATGAPGLFVLSGVAFGAALTGAGVRTWRAAGSGGHACRDGPSGVVG